MARRRIGMKALRQVIELHEKTEFSNRQIAAAAGVSRWPELSIVDTPNYADFLSA